MEQYSSNYLRALEVKFNEQGRETLKFLLSQLKSKTQVYFKYLNLSLINYLSKRTGSTWDSINIIQNGKFFISV